MKTLAILWGIKNSNTLKSKANYLAKMGKLIKIRYGLYALDENYAKFELAGKLLSPSYVSLETVLGMEGVIFQYSEEVISISNTTRNYEIDGKAYRYRKMKDIILFEKAGINFFDNQAIASKERAFLDMIYLSKNYYFDNLRSIDWEKCRLLAKLYKNKNLVERLEEYNKIYKKHYVE